MAEYNYVHHILSSFNATHVIILLLTIFLIIIRTTSAALKRSPSPSPAVGLLPPGPWKLPIIGSLLHMVGSQPPHRRLMDLAKKHGPLMHVQLGETSNVIVSSSDLAREFLQTHDLNFATRPMFPAARILSYGARSISFAPYGEYWRLVRKICAQELLSSKRVDSIRPIMADEAGQMVASVRQQARPQEDVGINLSRMIISAGNAIISRAAFGKTQAQEGAFLPVMHEIVEAYGGFDLGNLFPSSKLVRLLSGTERQAHKLRDQADVILEAIIGDHIAKKTGRRAKLAEEEEEEEEDLLDVLLNFRDQLWLGLAEIKAVVLDIFLAGSDTFSSTLEWAMSELVRNPHTLEKAQREVRRVFDEKGIVHEAGLEELSYLKLVVKEALRLHPPAPLLAPRECRETVTIAGYQIPKGTRVMVNVFSIGRDPRYWTDPETFEPERFADRNAIFGTEFESIPFGAGRRGCPGMFFGTTLVEVLLANLLYHFDWQLPHGVRPRDLDMSENFGIAVRRKIDLHLVPIPYNPTN